MNAEELRAALGPFDFQVPNRPSELLTGYRRFYGLDFTDLGDITHQVGYFDAGKYRIALQYFTQPEPRGTVFIQHGYYDHLGIYTHPIRHCLQSGYNVIGYDQPGHGLSTGERASIADFGDYQKTFTTCLDRCRDHCPRPWLILGQSMGGAIAMTYLLNNPDSPFIKAILFAPLVHPAGWWIGRWLHALAKHLISRQNRMFAENSHDKEFLRFLREDDFLQARELPMQWVTAMKRWISEFHTLGTNKIDMLVLQGTDDRTVAWRYNMKVVSTKFPNAEIHYLPSAGHQLVNESLPYRVQMFDIMDRFLGRD